MLVLQKFLRDGAFGKGDLAGQEIIERAPQAVNVATDGGCLRIEGLFRRQEIDGPEDRFGCDLLLGPLTGRP